MLLACVETHERECHDICLQTITPLARDCDFATAGSVLTLSSGRDHEQILCSLMSVDQDGTINIEPSSLIARILSKLCDLMVRCLSDRLPHLTVSLNLTAMMRSRYGNLLTAMMFSRPQLTRLSGSFLLVKRSIREVTHTRVEATGFAAESALDLLLRQARQAARPGYAPGTETSSLG